MAYNWQLMMMIHRLHWWVSLMVLVLVLHQCFNGQFCLGCLEEERAALLQFKSFVNWTDTAKPGLASWVDHRENNKNSSSTNCCNWERVQCNLTTGRVTHLFLNFTRGGSISDVLSFTERSEAIQTNLPREGSALDYVMRFTWFINAKLFLPFQQLQHLDLSFNFINGWLENEGFEILVGLKKLMILELQGNQFNNSILTSLSALPSLQELNLGHNNFTVGPSLKQGFQRLSTLRRLQTLNLDDNYLGDSILSYLTSFTFLKVLSLKNNKLNVSPTSPQGLGILSGFKSLEVLELSMNNFNNNILPTMGAFTSLKELYLSHNHLDGSLPLGSDIWSGLKNLKVMHLRSASLSQELLSSLGALTSLKELDLSDNNLNGYFPQELCRLRNLEVLFLRINRFEGILPTCLNNLTSLRVLDLLQNLFRGSIASSPLSNLTSLEMISLGFNRFDAAFPLTSFYNHSNLVQVKLDYYSANSKIKLEHHADLLPKFQLKAFQLSFCSFQEPTDIALKFLYNQYDLRTLVLKQANLTGKFPNWLIKNNTRLGLLTLRGNSFTGHFHLPSYPQTSLSVMDISNNNIHGHLQENIGKILPNLLYLNLSRNTFGGKIPSTIGVMKQLQLLDFSSNNFSGEVPESLAIGCTKLEVLKLSNNSLFGQILPNDFHMLPMLQVLYLDSNNFTGTLPFGISKCFHLGILDVGRNHLSGTIPSWIGNLTTLTTLVMRNNLLEGHITLEICKLLKIEVLDLSQNQLSGLLPSCLNLPHLQYLHLEGNGFTGSIPNTLLHSTALETLSLGDNKFSGSLPNWIGELTNLKILALKGNFLSGPLPYQLCHLNLMRIMDLSNNNFSRLIPPCFSNITFGKKTSALDSTVGLTKYWQLFTSAPITPNILSKGKQVMFNGFEITAQEEVQFITKSISNFYKGNVLKIMSGMDLSCNSFTGEIPHEIGNLTEIHALNLSHNRLSGRIPESLSNLKQVESLDLSFNKLSGGIPQEFVSLTFLAVFSVAHNNLSGRIPDWKAQFATFKKSSYEGNPFLCGAPLLKTCTNIATTDPEIAVSNRWEDKYGINAGCFFASFATSWFISLLAVIVVLYINPHWRQMWFGFIDACIASCLCFKSNMFKKLSTLFM